MKIRCFLGSAAALGLLASTLWADEPTGYYAYSGYPGYGDCETCSNGCWATPGCCNRPVSKYDHLWDSYCQEKWCPYVDVARHQTCWHGGPMVASNRTATAPSHAPVVTKPVNTEATVISSPVRIPNTQPTPAAPPRRDPPRAPEVKPPMPPEPKTNEPLELRLLPLSRPRPAQP